MAKAKQNGVGYNGPNSTRPTQPQEGDYANEGGASSLVTYCGASA